MLSKTCTVCKQLKNLSEFYAESRVKDGKQAKCKTCTCKMTAEYRKKNPEIYRKASLKHWNNLDDKKKHARWIKRYGVTSEMYLDMFNKQKGTCKICQKECVSGQVLSIDHCHKTNIVRGLLCKKCNSALGMLNDNIEFFESAITYLKNSAKLI